MSVRHILISILFSICSLLLFGQTTTVIPSSFIAGNAATSYVEEWSPFQTPASLASESGLSLQIAAENKYLAKELFNEVFGLSAHTKYLNVGVSLSHFGYGDYHELLAGVVFARSFADRVNVGIQANYYTMYFPELARYHGTVTAQLGVQCRVVKGFYLGFHTFNPTFSKIKSTGISTKLPVIFSLGMLHVVNDMFNWTVQLDKDVWGAWRWAVGTEYRPFKQFTVRLGAYGQDFVPTLGVGLKFGEFRFNLHCEYHLKLGLCTLGQLSYRFGL